MKAPGQRGPFGDWLVHVRTQRYPKSQKQALDAYRKLAGLSISPSEYAQWESGSRVPKDSNPKVTRLYEFYGSRPEDPLPQADSDVTTALLRHAQAMEAQTAAFNRLAESIDRAALGVIGRVEEFGEALEDLGHAVRGARATPATGETAATGVPAGR